MEIVNVVNLTGKPVSWMYDGRMYDLKPYEERAMPAEVGLHGRAKTKFGMNMELGSWRYTLAIPQYGHPLDVLEEGQERQPGDELFDRATDPSGGKVQKKKFSNPELAMSRPMEAGL